MEFLSRRAVLGLVGATALAGTTLAGCGGGGSKSQTDVKVEATTKGQQLTDLKKALDSGAITKEQFDTEQKKILAE